MFSFPPIHATYCEYIAPACGGIIHSTFYSSDINISSGFKPKYFVPQLRQSLVVTNHLWTFLNVDWSLCDQNDVKKAMYCPKKKRSYGKIIYQNNGFVRIFLSSIFLNLRNFCYE